MAPARGTLSRQEKVLVGYAAVAHGLTHTLELSYAAILPFLLVEFGEGQFVLGLVATVFGFAFGAGSLPAGVLADRIGSKRLVEVCMLGAGLASGVVALSHNIYSLAAALTALGLALGLYHPAGNSLITRGVRARSKGLGYHGIGGNLGTAIAPLMAAGIAALYGWQAAYLAAGLLALAVGIAIRLSPMAEASLTPSSPDPAAADNGGKVLLGPLIGVFIVFVFTGFIYRGTLTFLPLHMKENAHFSIGTMDAVAIAGAFTSIALLFGIVGQWLGGTLGERVRREKLLLPMAVGVAIALLLMGLVGDLWLVAVAALFAIAYFMGQPVYTALIADYSPPRLQGRMFGISFFIAFGLGSFSAGFSGFIAERLGTGAVFLSLSVVGVMVIALALYLLLATRRWRSALREMPTQGPGPRLY